MRELSLFSGAGGGLLATRYLLGWTCIGYVESDPGAQAILAARVRDGLLDDAPLFADVRTFLSDGHAERYRGVADVVTGGFPCQPHSQAGRRKGHADERNLWPETLAVLRAVRPRYALLENVAGLATSPGPDGEPYVWRILADLHEAGFDAEWVVLGADDVGAPHRRKRLWIVAHARKRGLRSRQRPLRAGELDVDWGGTRLADARRERDQRDGEGLQRQRRGDVADAAGPRRSDPEDAGPDRGNAEQRSRSIESQRSDRGLGDAAAARLSRTEEGCSGRGSAAAFDAGARMGDAIGPRLEGRASERGDAWAEREAAERAGGDALADAEDQRARQLSEQARRGLPDARRGSECLADADSRDGDRLHERVEPGYVAPDSRGGGAGDASDPPRWPPGPDAAHAWRAVLDRWPGLAPALSPGEEDRYGIRYPLARRTKAASPEVESTVRRVAARLPGGLGRPAQLRGLGNAQVPDVVALAWRLLTGPP